MNNVGTYSGYTLLFDSEVVPEAAFARQQRAGAAASGAVVDLSSLPSFKALQEAGQPDMAAGIEQLERLLGTAAADQDAALADAAALVQEALQTRQRAPAAAAPAGPVRIYRPRTRRAAAAAAAAAAAMDGVEAAVGGGPEAQQEQGELSAAGGEGAAAASGGDDAAMYDADACMPEAGLEGQEEGQEEEEEEMVEVPHGDGEGCWAAGLGPLRWAPGA
jgi:hypothetical protein